MTLVVDRLQDDGTGNSDAVQDIIDGRAKAYVSSNSDGTTTRASFNISSMTDRGTGALDANLSVTFADRPTKLCSCGSGNVRIGQETGAGLLDEVEMRTYDDTGSPSDSGDNHIVCHGDLA
jgi:hypothetical protein